MVEPPALGLPTAWGHGWHVELVQDAQRATTVGTREEAGEGEAVGGVSMADTVVFASRVTGGSVLERVGVCWLCA